MGNAIPFPLGQARKLVADLFTPRPWIYWTDFLLTATVAYSAASVYLGAPFLSWPKLASLPIAVLGLFRLSLFMHEIVHFKKGEMTGFKVAWNLVAGIPMLTPSFLYDCHLAHHNTHHYGTGNDGEYLPLAGGRYREFIYFLLQPLYFPGYVAFRFLVLTPVSFLHPELRRWVLERASSFVINFSFRREIPENAPRRIWALVEWACFLRVAAIPTTIILFDRPWTVILSLYSLATCTLCLNHVRTLVAHRYESDGKTRSHVDQLDDSVNVSGRTPLIALMFPVGLRYHALHHLFPSLPYHNLGEAHRRLMRELPADSIYHQSTYLTFPAAIAALGRHFLAAARNAPKVADLWNASRRELSRPVATELDTDLPPLNAPSTRSAA